MALSMPGALANAVRSKYASAIAANALVFSETEPFVVDLSGIPFQLRYTPGLAKKPTPLKDSTLADRHPTKKFDPFENPDPELLIKDIPEDDPSHNLILNKFPIIKHHFILATKSNKQQTHFLEQDDLWLTYDCLREWQSSNVSPKDPENQLFAFFNSGPHSGASQPRRHVQLMPVADLRADLPDPDAWNLLVDNIMSGPDHNHSEQGGARELSFWKVRRDVPFQHFAARLPPDPSPEYLHQVYHNLYDACLDSVRLYIESNSDSPDLELHPDDGGSLPVSYNLAMTTTAIVICPRRKESISIQDEGGKPLGDVSPNGTMLAGTALVKSEELFSYLKAETQLSKVLRAVGLPLGSP